MANDLKITRVRYLRVKLINTYVKRGLKDITPVTGINWNCRQRKMLTLFVVTLIFKFIIKLRSPPKTWVWNKRGGWEIY